MAITIALIIVASTTVYFLLRRYVKKLIVGSIKSNTQASKVVQEIVEEVNALIVEFNGITDRNVTIVEEKIARLSSLVEKSRHAITILSTYSFDSIAHTHNTNNTNRTAHPTEHLSTSERSVDATITSYADGTHSGDNYSISTVHQGRSATAPPTSQREDIVSHIKRLHRQHADIATIAKQVGIPISEVETYISLFDVN